MKKSTLWLLSLLVILALILVACSSGEEEGSATDGDDTITETDDAMDDDAMDEDDDGDMEDADDDMMEDEEGCASDAVLCVGLVTDVGEVDDKSFNQSAWEGVQLAEKELGAQVDFIETKDAKDYQANIDLFAKEGYDVIVTVGFALGEATAAAAASYPDIDFIGVDQFQGEPVDNVAGLIFPEDRAGFLAGALAAMLSESGSIAAVLGTDLVPPVVAFGEGYLNGAAYINPDIESLATYHPGGLDVAFTDPEWGAATARQAIDNGADVIFGAGGKTGNGALIEVASADGTYCIGVDTDQWETVPEAHPCLVSSAMKLITPGVMDLISASNDGAFPSGNFIGEVGLAPFHDFDSAVSDEIKSRLEEIDGMLRDGSLATGYGAALDESAEADDEAMDEGEEGDCSSPDVLCVGLVTDVGEVDDKSFNQSAWEGVMAAEKELGAQVDFIETKDAKDYAENIGLFANAGYDVIVTVGFALGEATAIAAAEYPDIHFIGVDQFQGEPVDNVAGLLFPEDRAGFMAGALAAMLSESGSIAAVLGTDLVPPVVAFGEGYLNGAAYINPDIESLATYHPGGLDVAFTDPEWGAATARQAIDNGADVIFGAGGKTGNGALIEVASADGVFCIGVDTDQWETVPEAHPCLVSSAMKLITPGVLELIMASADGNFPAGNYFGEVGLAPFHDFDADISDEIKARLEEIDAMLRDGSLETGYNPGG